MNEFWEYGIQLGLCYLHFLTLRYSTQRNSLFLVGFIVICPILFLNLSFKTIGYIMMVNLRLLDISLLDRNLTRKWSLRDYTECFWTARPKEDRRLEVEKCRSILKGDCKNTRALQVLDSEIQLNKVGRQYWIHLGVRISFHIAIFIGIPMYFHIFRPNWNPPEHQLLNIFMDLDGVVHYYLYFILLKTSILLSREFFSHAIGYVLDFPVKASMRQPYFALSLSEFWGCWNITVQSCIRRIAYDPIIRMGNSRNMRLLAVINTFLVSGLMHEWVVLALEKSTNFEQLRFFMIHCALVINETIMVDLVFRRTGYHIIKDTHPYILYFYIHAVTMTTAPLILNFFIKGNRFLDILYPFSELYTRLPSVPIYF